MAAPTRPQIENSFAKPTYLVEVLDQDGIWHSVLNARVVTVSGSADSTGNQDNGVSFGTPSNPSATVEMEDYIVDGTHYMHDTYWINQCCRVSFGFDTSDLVVVYQGPIKSMSRTNESISLDLGGSLDYLADVKIHTPIYYRKPAATETTIASQEDPDGIGYSAGLINLALWRAGGRPIEQQDIPYTEESTGWKFWYSCDQSLIAPDFSWFSGDNTQDEVYTLCRAVGGQLYQDTYGVVRYREPLRFGDTTGYGGYYTFSDDIFDGYSENISKNELVGTLKMTYTPRKIEPMQVVVEDTTARLIDPYVIVGLPTIIELSPDKPVYAYQGLVTDDDITATNTMKAQLLDNRIVTPDIGTVTQYASKVSINVSNSDSATPMILTSIKIEGRPLSAADDLHIQYPDPFSASLPEKVVENNVYVQNEAHAKMLIRMIYDFYNQLTAIITLNNVQYDPDRYVGEIVQLDSTYNSDILKFFRIIKIAHTALGTSMSVDLVQITHIPVRSDMFIIGESYSGSDERELSY